MTKKEVKKEVMDAKYNALMKVYIRIWNKRGRERDIYKLVRAREKKRRDLGNIRWIDSEDYEVLVR